MNSDSKFLRLGGTLHPHKCVQPYFTPSNTLHLENFPFPAPCAEISFLKAHLLWDVFSDGATQWSQNLSALDIRDLHLPQGLVQCLESPRTGATPSLFQHSPSPQDTGASFKCVTVTHSCVPPSSYWSDCSCGQRQWNGPARVGVKDWV